MPSRRSLSKQVFFVLLVFSAVTAACGSDTSANEPTQPSGDQLTAEQILALAESATSSAVAYRIDSQYVIDVADMERQTADITVEWTSPDRMRELHQSDSEDDRSAFGVIQIGDQSFLGWGASIDDIEWEESRQVEDADNERVSPLAAYGLSEAEITGEEVIDGMPVYRLEGIPTLAGNIEENDMTVVESSQTSYVATSDFRTVRVETHIAYEMPDDDPGGPATRLNDMTMEMDVTYFADPIEIEPPDSYVPLNDPDDSAPWTPTPTATVAPDPMATPTPTPTPNMAPANLLEHLHETLAEMPAYDKMEIGDDIVIVFSPCERPNVGYLTAHVRIIYLPDGSAIINEYSDPGFNLRKFESVEAEQALTAVVEDETLISEILEKSARPQRCPAQMVEAMRAEFDAAPDYDKHVIDGDTVAFFPSCDVYPNDTYEYAFTIDHFPTESSIGISADGQSYGRVRFGTPDGNAMLEDLFEDSQLIAELLGQSPQSERCDT